MTQEKIDLLNKILEDTPIVDPKEWIEEYEQGNAVHEKIGLYKAVWQKIISLENTQWLDESIEFLSQDFSGNLYAAAYVNDDPEFLEALEAIKESGVEIKHLNQVIKAMQLSVIYEIIALNDGIVEMENCNSIGLFTVVETEEGIEIQPDRPLGQMHDDFHLFDPDF